MRNLTALSLVLAASPAIAAEPEAQQQSTSAAISQAADQAAADESRGLDEGDIVVVATRIGGQIDAPQAPIATFDEAEIQALGASSVTELLARVSPQTGSGRGRGGGGQPVVLVNGQRITSFREMRNYPPEAIKRVDILPEEVALRFGFPPNTRVVNMILKDSYSNRRVELDHAIPTRGGFGQTELEATVLKIQKLNRFTVTASVDDTTPLFENERGLIQQSGSRPTVLTDPDPAAYRSLVADSRSYGLNAAWTKRLGENGTGGALTISAEANRSDTLALSGLDTVLLRDPSGAEALRSLPGGLERVTRSTTLAAGLGYNAILGRWQFTATLDGNHGETRSRFDRRADMSALVSQAAAGTLPITGPLPAIADAGFDTTTSNTDSMTSLVTMVGRPLRLPGGEVSTTFKAGYGWSGIDSADTRSTAGPVSLSRGDLSLGTNVAIPITSRRENYGAGVGDITLNLSAGWNHLTDFGDLTDWSAGLTWAPTEKLNLQGSYIVNQAAPGLSQLGNPQTVTFNVPVYDFSTGQTVLASVIGGGNPLLQREQQRDIKLSATWTLPFLQSSNLLVEWFRNRSSNVTASFPLLTPEIEAAFPGRVTRDANGQLLSIDQRPVTFASQESSRLRWGLNLSGALTKQAEGGAGPRAGGGGGGGPRGGFMGPMFGGGRGGAGGRWSLGLYHTVQFQNEVLVAPGGPVLDLLAGDALSTSGTPRHSLEFNGGLFYKGFGSFLQGSWNAPTRLDASGLPGTSDLRFGSVTNVNLNLFAELSMMTGVVKAVPFLKGSRLSLRFQNLFDSVQKVTDASGSVPLSYQRDYLDPRGRIIEVELRKSF